MRRATLLAMVLALVEGGVASARARLVYDRALGAETCPDEAALREKVTGELGRDVFEGGAPGDEALVVVRLDPDARGFRALVSVGDSGERTFVAPACADAVDAAAFAIAVVLGGPRARARLVAGPAASASVDDKAPSLAAEAAPRRGWGMSVGGGVTAAFGAVPDVAAGGRIGVELDRDGWTGGAELRLVAGERDVEEATVDVLRFDLTVLTCRRFAGVSTCAVLQPGVMFASPEEFAEPRSPALPLLAAGGRLSYAVGPVRATFDLTAELLRAELVAGDRTIWRQPVVSASLGIAAFVRIP